MLGYPTTEWTKGRSWKPYLWRKSRFLKMIHRQLIVSIVIANRFWTSCNSWKKRRRKEIQWAERFGWGLIHRSEMIYQGFWRINKRKKAKKRLKSSHSLAKHKYTNFYRPFHCRPRPNLIKGKSTINPVIRDIFRFQAERKIVVQKLNSSIPWTTEKSRNQENNPNKAKNIQEFSTITDA